MSDEHVYTTIAVVSALLAVGKAAYDMWAGRRKDNQSLEIAKRQAPEVQKQLELGNFKAAMEGVNIAQTIMATELTRLQAREQALEAESSAWQRKAEQANHRADRAEERARKAEERAARVETLMARLEDRCTRLEAQVRSNRR